MRFESFLLLAGAATLVLVSRARAQSVFDTISTPAGPCAVWVGIPGGTGTQDLSYAKCALDRVPALQGEPTLPQPWTGSDVRGQFTVIVNADGSVDPKLTRAWQIGMDSVAYRTTLEGLRRWRFQAGTRGGVPVRSGFILQITTDQRNDTLPATLRWTYRAYPQGEDTLRGSWVTLRSRAARLTEEQADSLYAAMFRRLVDMRVVAPWLGRTHCLVPEAGLREEDTARAARVLWRLFSTENADPRSRRYWDMAHPVITAESGCERRPGMLRLFVPRMHRTEGHRVVLHPAGDYLADWPPVFRGATYPGWSGHCVADVPPASTPAVHCDVSPNHTAERRVSPRGFAEEPRWYSPGTPVHLTVVANLNHAFQADTLQATVRDVRRFGESAALTANSECSSS